MSTSIITSFFSSYEIVIGKNVREELDKFVVCKFYLIVHCFHARVQSPTCTTYGKYLLENVMAVQILKSGIVWYEFSVNLRIVYREFSASCKNYLD